MATSRLHFSDTKHAIILSYMIILWRGRVTIGLIGRKSNLSCDQRNLTSPLRFSYIPNFIIFLYNTMYVYMYVIVIYYYTSILCVFHNNNIILYIVEMYTMMKTWRFVGLVNHTALMGKEKKIVCNKVTNWTY